MPIPRDPLFGRNPAYPEWCLVCSTRHAGDVKCPGQVVATGPERFGWKVLVETPHSMEAYGVLVAPAGDRWRARILTFPRSLWTVPGGRGILKFLAKTPQAAEEQAIRFIEEFCVTRGYVLRHGLEVSDGTAARSLDGRASPGRAIPITTVAPRWPMVLPVQFGIGTPSLRAITRNVSEGGVFVQTPRPVEPGREIQIRLTVAPARLRMAGVVAWNCDGMRIGRPPGMGVRFVATPEAYLEYIRSLPAPLPADGF